MVPVLCTNPSNSFPTSPRWCPKGWQGSSSFWRLPQNASLCAALPRLTSFKCPCAHLTQALWPHGFPSTWPAPASLRPFLSSSFLSALYSNSIYWVTSSQTTEFIYFLPFYCISVYRWWTCCVRFKCIARWFSYAYTWIYSLSNSFPI